MTTNAMLPVALDNQTKPVCSPIGTSGPRVEIDIRDISHRGVLKSSNIPPIRIIPNKLTFIMLPWLARAIQKSNPATPIARLIIRIVNISHLGFLPREKEGILELNHRGPLDSRNKENMKEVSRITT